MLINSQRFILSLLLVVLLQCQVSFAQNTRISCHISGSSDKDTVVLFFFPQKFGIASAGVQRFACAGSKGDFQFLLPPMKHPGMVSMVLKRNHANLLQQQWIAPGDKLLILTDTTAAAIEIEGEQSAKNKLQQSWQQWLRSKNKQGPLASDAILFSRYRNPEEALEHILQVAAKEKAAWEEMAAPLQNQVEPMMLRTLAADHGWKTLLHLLSYTNESWEKSFKAEDGVKLRGLLQNFYESTITPLLQQQLEQSTNAYTSPVLLDFAVRKTMTDARMQQGNLEAIEALHYLPFLAQWPEAIHDAVCTALITYLYSYSPNVLHTDKLAEAILAGMSDPGMISRVRAFLQRLQPGTPLYPFELKDEKGTIWTADALKQKAIVMDFWFNGCKACTILANDLRKLKTALGNRSDIAFVSINVDPSRGRWLNGLETGLYTDPENINLFTEGLAIEHPLAKNYEVSACPRLLIFAKGGKLHSADPPMSGPNLLEDLRAMVEEAAR